MILPLGSWTLHARQPAEVKCYTKRTTRIFLHREPVNFGKTVDELSAIVDDEMKRSPFSRECSGETEPLFPSMVCHCSDHCRAEFNVGRAGFAGVLRD